MSGGNFFASEMSARQTLELAPLIKALEGSKMSSSRMAAALNAMGIKTWRGGAWKEPTVRKLRERVRRLFPTVVRKADGAATGDKLSTLEGSSPRAPEKPRIAQNGRG